MTSRSESDIPPITNLLPHRYPMLLIDRILVLDSDDFDTNQIVAIKNVTRNEEFFQGHFPNNPVMPGVLTLEALAQAAGCLGVSLSDHPYDSSIILYFAGAEHVRFKQPVVPGDQLRLTARCVSHKCGVWKFDCVAYVDDHVVCSAQITCAEKHQESK